MNHHNNNNNLNIKDEILNQGKRTYHQEDLHRSMDANNDDWRSSEQNKNVSVTRTVKIVENSFRGESVMNFKEAGPYRLSIDVRIIDRSGVRWQPSPPRHYRVHVEQKKFKHRVTR
eukprot:gb/GECH01006774.1/.p1 GENE.gb/GECH01006774.1/~~gb/GECH01006774.1/.p1  ORF type:complete len:116 (+),score=33.28 gb/GECH01006774.1/:1-348(+)